MDFSNQKLVFSSPSWVLNKSIPRKIQFSTLEHLAAADKNIDIWAKGQNSKSKRRNLLALTVFLRDSLTFRELSSLI